MNLDYLSLQDTDKTQQKKVRNCVVKHWIRILAFNKAIVLPSPRELRVR